MQQEKYSLTWHTYSYHMKSMMNELMMNEDFSDVKLVTEDKKQIMANIGVLSAFSPVFNNILMKEKNINQIVYLRGIQYSEMESIMQFIYHGKATFYGERMDEFLAVAKSLEIKELCNAETNDDIGLDDESSLSDNSQVEKSKDEISDNTMEQASQVKGCVGSKNRKYECDQCHKTYSSPQHLYTHKQSAHNGVKYACDQCDYKANQKTNLTRHVQSKHNFVKYACDWCDQQFTCQQYLDMHIQSKHEGKRYACDQCDFQGSYPGSLYLHIQSKHVGVKYACDQCDFQATRKGHLKGHIKNKHEGVRYGCDHCDHQATRKEHLREHMKKKHVILS